MEEDFYRGRLESRHGLEVLTPPSDQRALVHGVIYGELCLGRVLDDSRRAFQQVVTDLVARGAQGVILGCTEIGLLLGPGDAPVPLFDTAAIHAEAAAEFALDVSSEPPQRRQRPPGAVIARDGLARRRPVSGQARGHIWAGRDGPETASNS